MCMQFLVKFFGSFEAWNQIVSYLNKVNLPWGMMGSLLYRFTQNAEDEFRPLSQSSLSTGRHSIVSALPDDESVDDESVLSTTRDSVAKKLPRETLDQLLAEVCYSEEISFIQFKN